MVRQSWLGIVSILVLLLLWHHPLQSTAEFSVDVAELLPQEFALLQFDSRRLKNYWLTAAQWNHAYCQRHGHRFLYYTTNDTCHHGHEPLASAWCKVRITRSKLKLIALTLKSSCCLQRSKR